MFALTCTSQAPVVIPHSCKLFIGQSHELSVQLSTQSEATIAPESTEAEKGNSTATHELIPNGANTTVTDANKKEYVRLVTQRKLCEDVDAQMEAFMRGFTKLVPKECISGLDESELELVLCGLPNIDVDDWRRNTEYKNGYTDSHQVLSAAPGSLASTRNVSCRSSSGFGKF